MLSLLSGNKVVLRAVEPEDLDFLYECENNTEIWRISNTLSPYSRYILKLYIQNSHKDIYENKELRLIIVKKEDEKQQLGAIDLFDFDPYNMRAGIGILINRESDRNKGYAADALKVMIKYSFSYLKLHQLYCNISESNSKSIALFEKVGFVKCGEKKEWQKSPNGWEAELMFQLINGMIS